MNKHIILFISLFFILPNSNAWESSIHKDVIICELFGEKNIYKEYHLSSDSLLKDISLDDAILNLLQKEVEIKQMVIKSPSDTHKKLDIFAAIRHTLSAECLNTVYLPGDIIYEFEKFTAEETAYGYALTRKGRLIAISSSHIIPKHAF